MREPKIVTRETVYYSITIFGNSDYWGREFGRVYKTLAGAARRCEDLYNSGAYKCVVLRDNKVFRRDETCELSSSGPVKIWGRV